MTKKTIELETPYTAEGRLAPIGFQLRPIRIQGRLYLDVFGRYWPMPQPRRWLRRVWARLTRQ
jgi:hypothetical protein